MPLNAPLSLKKYTQPTVNIRHQIPGDLFANLVIYKTLLVSLIFLICISFIQCDQVNRSTDQFHGTKLASKVGKDFELADQRGELVSNFAHGGKAAILTFLFSDCTDVCPIVTSQIKAALANSEKLSHIPVMIITVDPDIDDQQTRLEFVNKWDLTSNWHFLSGDHRLLSDIWNSYHVNPQNTPVNTQQGLQNSLVAKYKVIHTTPVYLLDIKGKPTILHTTPINSKDLRSDLYTMIRK